MTHPHHKPKIVCECLKVTEAALLRAIQQRRIKTVKDIIEYTQAGDGCTACHPLLKEYLERELCRDASRPAQPPE